MQKTMRKITKKYQLKQPVSLIIMDWDATLVDSHKAIAQSYQHACSILNLTIPSESAIRQTIGHSAQKSLELLYPGLDIDSIFDRFITEYRAYYAQQSVVVFTGISKTLKALKSRDIQLAIASNKNRVALERELQSTQLHSLFSQVQCPPATNPKPAPDMIVNIYQALNIPKEQTCMVGDHINDILAAQAAGVQVVSVLSGDQSFESLSQYKPDAILSGVEQLPALIEA